MLKVECTSIERGAATKPVFDAYFRQISLRRVVVIVPGVVAQRRIELCQSAAGVAEWGEALEDRTG